MLREHTGRCDAKDVSLDAGHAMCLRRLISSRSDFAKCKHFETRVDCYKQCPEIDSDGRVRESSPSWREGCY